MGREMTNSIRRWIKLAVFVFAALVVLGGPSPATEIGDVGLADQRIQVRHGRDALAHESLAKENDAVANDKDLGVFLEKQVPQQLTIAREGAPPAVDSKSKEAWFQSVDWTAVLTAVGALLGAFVGGGWSARKQADYANQAAAKKLAAEVHSFSGTLAIELEIILQLLFSKFRGANAFGEEVFAKFEGVTCKEISECIVFYRHGADFIGRLDEGCAVQVVRSYSLLLAVANDQSQGGMVVQKTKLLFAMLHALEAVRLLRGGCFGKFPIKRATYDLLSTSADVFKDHGNPKIEDQLEAWKGQYSGFLADDAK